MKEEIRKEIELLEGSSAALDGFVLTINGPKGGVTRDFSNPKISIRTENNKVILLAKNATKREKARLGAMEAHIKNMVKGVVEPFVYKLKVCSGHFPMNVSVAGSELIIKNFLGESVPRKVSLQSEVDVKVNGSEVVVSSPDKEKAGQAAARIESACRITNRDLRIFQDGIYITHKAGKDIA